MYRFARAYNSYKIFIYLLILNFYLFILFVIYSVFPWRENMSPWLWSSKYQSHAIQSNALFRTICGELGHLLNSLKQQGTIQIQTWCTSAVPQGYVRGKTSNKNNMRLLLIQIFERNHKPRWGRRRGRDSHVKGQICLWSCLVV